MKITNKTAAFGTVMIIYESRPDVTVEAGGIAFKSGNKILLKGGKESLLSNLKIVELWHQALKENEVAENWVEYLNYNRAETQAFLEKPTQRVDLIVPRGGEQLIAFVKQHATCPVIVSGRGNNFVFVNREADLQKATDIIINGKTSNISVCNALDKVLIDTNLDHWETFAQQIVNQLQEHNVTVLGDQKVANATGKLPIIYSNPTFLKNHLSGDASLANYPLWAANYFDVSNPGVSPKVGCLNTVWTGDGCNLRWTFWQYSQTGPGGTFGVSSRGIDLNVFAGSAEELLALALRKIHAKLKNLHAEFEKEIAETSQKMIDPKLFLAQFSKIIR